MRQFLRVAVFAALVLAITASALSQQPVGFSVRGKATNLPKELFVTGPALLHLQPIGAEDPLYSAPVQADGTFEFKNIPPGTYWVPFADLNARAEPTTPTITVSKSDIATYEIDLKNNPFPESPRQSYAATFNFRKQVPLEGIVTSTLAFAGEPRATQMQYFRMKVGEGSWAVKLRGNSSVPPTPENSPLHVGDRVRLTVYPASDGNPRGVLIQPDRQNDPLSGVTVIASN